jgi:uncharacterized protein YigE (DUF2233 family)
MSLNRLIVPLILIVGFFSAGQFLLISQNRFKTPTTTLLPTSTPYPTSAPAKHLTFQGRDYSYHYFSITKSSASKLILIPNFSQKLNTRQIIDQNKCDFGINGGFYLKNNTPLGLFYVNSQSLGSLIQSATFNGFLGSDENHQLSILSPDQVNQTNLEAKIKSNSYQFIFQSGPLYQLQNQWPSTFTDQKYARRHLVATDSQGTFYFFTIFETKQAYSGPRLEDIPSIFYSSDFKQIADFTQVLNLDGGSASAFYLKASNVKVEELSPVGSFLCGQTNTP